MQHHFFPQNFHKSVYVASIKGDFEAYLFSGGVRAIVRSILWIVVGFCCRRREEEVREEHTDW